MTPERKNKITDYIAAGLKYAKQEAVNVEWPENTIIITKTYGELAETDNILGIKIYVTNMQSPDEFALAFGPMNTGCDKLLKAFAEYQDLFPLDD